MLNGLSQLSIKRLGLFRDLYTIPTLFHAKRNNSLVL